MCKLRASFFAALFLLVGTACVHRPPVADTTCPACQPPVEGEAAIVTEGSEGSAKRVMVVPPSCEGPDALCEKLLSEDFTRNAVAHLTEHGYQAVTGGEAVARAAAYRSAPGEIGLVQMLLVKLENESRPDRYQREAEIFSQLLMTREKVLTHLEVEAVLRIQLVVGQVEKRHEVEAVLRLELGDEGSLGWQSRCLRTSEEASAVGAVRCALEGIPDASSLRSSS